MTKRPPISSELQRAILVEAGHRCAIPTCRQVPVEIAHIVAWTKCKEHKFDNLIALCPTCHSRFDKKEIDFKSMLVYKQNLALLNNRFGEFERRVLERFAANPSVDEFWLLTDLEILVSYLREDGLLTVVATESIAGGADGLSRTRFKFTSKGLDFIAGWTPVGEPD